MPGVAETRHSIMPSSQCSYSTAASSSNYTVASASTSTSARGLRDDHPFRASISPSTGVHDMGASSILVGEAHVPDWSTSPNLASSRGHAHRQARIHGPVSPPRKVAHVPLATALFDPPKPSPDGERAAVSTAPRLDLAAEPTRDSSDHAVPANTTKTPATVVSASTRSSPTPRTSRTPSARSSRAPSLADSTTPLVPHDTDMSTAGAGACASATERKAKRRGRIFDAAQSLNIRRCLAAPPCSEDQARMFVAELRNLGVM